MSDDTGPIDVEASVRPVTTLARRNGAVAAPAPVAAGTSAPLPAVRAALPAMLQASVDAYGDVVKALLSDLHSAAADVGSLAWLAGSDQVLRDEALYRNAVAQLQWWDALLGSLPYPRLQSDRRAREVAQHRASRSRAQLLARDQALAEHRAAVQVELADPDLGPERRARLNAILDDPAGPEWRVDPADVEARALAALGPEPVLVPISVDDLDPTRPYTCFFAVDAMRNHPELGPRAAHMDAALTDVLVEHFGLSRKVAPTHARQLTDIFWVALRRTLEAGSHQLATTVHLLASANEAPVQAHFAREVLESWQHHLSTLPKPSLTLGQRIGRLLGRSPDNALPAAPDPKLLARDE